MKRIRVVIADDHIYAAEGLEKIVSEAEDMECVGSTTELLEVPALVKNKIPDVMVLDVAWLGDKMAGIHILPDIRNIQPDLPVVMVTVYPELLELAREAGAYPLSKGFSKHELLNAIRWAVRKPNNSSGPSSPSPVDMAPLTPAERTVLTHLITGMSDADIAKQLKRSEGTIKKHVSNILGKLGAKNRTEAAVTAERYNLTRKQ
jgi:DNA-binding NarL/FixJ family response regulator